MLGDLMRRNADWSARKTQDQPGYFARLATRQKPEFFRIGCSDSRVPANAGAGLDPREVFVHHIVANVVHSSDMNLLSALEFAVEALEIREVILCGHYGCGGVRAACEEYLPHGLADHWLEPIRRLARDHEKDLGAGVDRLRRLAELNVLDGVARVAETPILRRARTRDAPVRLHDLIYGIEDGLLHDLECTTAPVPASSRTSNRSATARDKIRRPV